MAQRKGPHFTLIQKTPPETEFYLLGWGVPTYDFALHLLVPLSLRVPASDGSWNATRYSNPEIDTDDPEPDQRDRHRPSATPRSPGSGASCSDETIYIALHHQMLAYAMKSELDIPVSPENAVYMKFVAAKP